MGRAALLTSAVLAGALSVPAAARVSLVVEQRPAGELAGALERAHVLVIPFVRERLIDPLQKGRFLSALQASERVVVVGLEASEWVARELEDVPVHFAGGLARVPGAALAGQPWSGTLGCSAAQFAGYARDAGWRRVTLLHTPGYERALGPLRDAARAAGLEVSDAAVRGRADLPRSAPRAMSAADALWLVGDPLLTQGAGFDYLVELSLSRKVPLIAPEPALVGGGALLACEPDPGRALRRGAAAALGPAPAPGSFSDGDAGRLLINKVLARKWGVPARGAAR